MSSPAGLIDSFTILYGFGPIVGRGGREGTSGSAQRIEPLGLGGLPQTVV